jgi:hypothetical protein
MKTIIISAVILGLALISCKKNKEEEQEEAFVGGITITTPAENDTVSGNYSILTGNIHGNLSLHGYHVVLYKASDNSVITEYEIDDHSTSITLNDTINYTVSAITPVRLKVESAYNHEGDMTTKEVNYVIQP